MTTEAIKSRLEDKISDALVSVSDMTGTSDHIQVFIISRVFEGKNRLQRQRLIYDIFAEELKTGEIHALTIQAKTPQESEDKL